MEVQQGVRWGDDDDRETFWRKCILVCFLQVWTCWGGWLWAGRRGLEQVSVVGAEKMGLVIVMDGAEEEVSAHRASCTPCGVPEILEIDPIQVLICDVIRRCCSFKSITSFIG